MAPSKRPLTSPSKSKSKAPSPWYCHECCEKFASENDRKEHMKSCYMLYVQVINPPSCLFQDNTVLDTDYLNPVPKDQIVRECGLRTVRNENDFYVTDIDPIELGVHMNSSGDDEVLFGDEFNLNYFGVVSGNNIMA